MRCIICVVIMLFISISIGISKDIVLLKDGSALCTIVIPTDPPEAVLLAAEELQYHFYEMTGVSVPIARESDVIVGLPVSLGETNIAQGMSVVEESRRLKRDGFIIDISKNGIVICGNEALGTLFGVYDFLEDFGIRWYAPGEEGTIIPIFSTLSIESGRHQEEPSVAYRAVGMNRWGRRNRCNINITSGQIDIGRKVDYKFHSFFRYMPPEKYKMDHPEYYALCAQSRHPEGRQQLCTTNPELIAVITQNISYSIETEGFEIISLSPEDGYGFCTCNHCTTLDEHNVPYDQGLSRRLNIFYGSVCSNLYDVYPEVLIKVGTYITYSRPPRDPSIVLPPNAMIHLTHYHPYCMAHRIDNPNCPPNQKYYQILKDWTERVQHIGIYEYHFKGTWLNLPWPIVENIKTDLPLYINEFHLEYLSNQYKSINHWSLLLQHYLTLRLMWDKDMDVEQTLDEFFELFYGPAAAPMRQYHNLLEQSFQTTDRHFSGGGKENAPAVFTSEMVRNCDDLLQQALDRTPRTGPYEIRMQKVEVFHGYWVFITNLFRRVEEVKASTLPVEEKVAQLEALHSEGRLFLRHMQGFQGDYIDLIAFTNMTAPKRSSYTARRIDWILSRDAQAVQGLPRIKD